MNILGVIGGLVTFAGVIIGGVQYLNGISDKGDKTEVRVTNLEGANTTIQSTVDKIKVTADAAANDSAATRAYTAYIIKTYGLKPTDLYRDPPAPTSTDVTMLGR